jgi:hypothetical protein
MPAPKKYATEEERLKAYKEQQNKYAKKKVICSACQMTHTLGNKTKHLRSYSHLAIVNRGSNAINSDNRNINEQQ